MAVDDALLQTVREGIARREGGTDHEWLRGLNRVEIVRVDHLTYHARSTSEPQFQLTIDEPPERGGEHQGPSPLIYFLTGVGACLLNQFVRLNIARGLDVNFKRVSVRGEFGRQVGGGFEHITQEVYAEGTASPAQLQKLCEEAEAFCYVYATLSRAVKMTTVLYVNRQEAARRTSTPA